MRNWKGISTGLAAAALAGLAQVPPESAIGHSNFSGFASTRPFTLGGSLPAACVVGQMFFNTAAPAGQNLYACASTNTWTQIVGTVSVSASGVGAALIVTDTGTVNAYSGCPSPAATLTDGAVVFLRALATNTGPATMSLCGSAAIPVVHGSGSSLSAGEIIAATAANPAQAILIYHAASNRFELANQPYPILPAQSIVSKYAVPMTNLSGYQYMRAILNPADGRRNALFAADGSTGLSGFGLAQFSVNSSAGTSSPVAAAGSNPVMTQTTTGTTSGNSAEHFEAVSGTFNTNIFRLGRNVVFNWWGAIGSTSSVRFWVGLNNCGAQMLTVDTLDAGSCAGEAFRYSTSVSDTTIHCMMSNGSTADTNVDSGVAPDTNPHNFLIVNDDAGSALHWYIDSVEVCSGYSVTNEPTGNVGGWASVTTLTGSSNSIATASLFIGADK
jgi:hypothetical protein